MDGISNILGERHEIKNPRWHGRLVRLVRLFCQLQPWGSPWGENPRKKPPRKSSSSRTRSPGSTLQRGLSSRWHRIFCQPLHNTYSSDCSKVEINLAQVSKNAEYQLTANLTKPSTHNVLSSLIFVSILWFNLKRFSKLDFGKFLGCLVQNYLNSRSSIIQH